MDHSLITQALGLHVGQKILPKSLVCVHMTSHQSWEEELAYAISESPFGTLLLVASKQGLCRMEFFSSPAQALDHLNALAPKAQLSPQWTVDMEKALACLKGTFSLESPIHLHLVGSPFQCNVWECLLDIPFGHWVSYGQLAEYLGLPHGARAVGTAVGANPLAFLIPCHRVLGSNKTLQGYRWGLERKKALLAWEIKDCPRF